MTPNIALCVNWLQVPKGQCYVWRFLICAAIEPRQGFACLAWSILSFTCECVCPLCVCVCVSCWGQRRVSEPLQLESEAVASRHAGAGDPGPDWSTEQVPSHPAMHRETLSQKKKGGGEEEKEEEEEEFS